MITIERFAEPEHPASDRLELPFDQRCRSRLRAQLASGEECGLFLERGTVLRNGDHLLGNDGRVIEIVAAAEPLMEAESSDPLRIAQAAYHLGNRHVAVHLLPGRLRFFADHVLGDMVQGLGLVVREVCASFEPERGAYGAHAHPHGHHPDGEGRGPRIHDQARPHAHDHSHPRS